jgi:OOP family OmpA-OmpF porin
MRNRNLILILTVLVAGGLMAGCGSMRQATKAETDQMNALQGKIAKAVQMDAKNCAPKELAYAEADLDQVRLETTQGWETAKPEIAKAEKSVDTLAKKIQECEEKKLVPTCGLVADPETIAPGKCAMLKWKAEYLTQLYFGEEDAKKKDSEPMSGSREVCPKETTSYNMVCKGKWATNYETATVTVEEPKPVAMAPAPVVAPMAVPVAKKEMTLRVNFDTAKANIRPADLAELQKGVQFLKDNPDAKIHIVGYTDSRGGDKYNQKLSEKRAESVKKYLEGEVSIKPEQITSEGKGKADPIGDNKTKDGQFQNRRVVLTIK